MRCEARQPLQQQSLIAGPGAAAAGGAGKCKGLQAPLPSSQDSLPSLAASTTDFKRSAGRYLKDVFSMPGAITNQAVGSRAAREQWAADQEFIHRDERVWDALPATQVR